ncbi:uncharacterized protein A1O5_05306 [Cladophialophora psammophila CBS 110553]|uniref:Clr5 domain-containing protein n=1 Tax=Cladophialophora psammophila CBS 110553 TaxID=1182543 RepID=W9WU79_9EURO|nr:uncharacterized protein A1O5_05306 [Cladophialophora psammophila CBS 110553]EXJ71498.1 hypothetical protein A1O5_05306 [Cladophialophora psammophila CBS 110553]
MSLPKSPRLYDPNKRGNAPRIPNATWEKFRKEITTLHHEGYWKPKILEVLKSMEFEPSYYQLRRRMEKWGLNAHTDEATFADLSMASTGAVTGSNLENGSSVEHYMIPDHASVVTPNTATALSSQATSDVQSLPQRGSFGMRRDHTFRETADQTMPAEQSPSPYGGLEVEQLAARIEPKANSLTRNSLEMPPPRPTGAPYINPHDIISSPSERSNVNSACYERRSSQISSTPPLTLAETASTDDASITNRKLSEEVPTRLVDQASSSQSTPPNSSRDFESEPGSTATPFVTPISIVKVIDSSLLRLWPAFDDPRTLSASDVCEIQGVAATLAAAGLFDDAFDLFYVEYKYWQACISNISTDEIYPLLATSVDNSTRCMVTAAINCARNSRPGRRGEMAYQALLNVQTLLQAYGFAYRLDMTLLNLYLSYLSKKDPKYTALDMAVSCFGERFAVILPEVQDREHVFITSSLASSLKEMLRDGLPSGTWHISSRCLELQAEYHEHLSDCEEVRTAMRTILEWCKTFVERNRRTLNKAGACSPIAAWSRVSAAWVLYCSCVFGISSFDSLVQNTESICHVPLCTHGVKPLKLDILLALAVICESFLRSGAEKTRRLLLGPRFGDYLQGEINASITNWPARGPDIVGVYLSRMADIPTAPKCPEAISGASSVLVKEYIVAAFRTRESSLRIDRTSFSESALLAYSSLHILGDSISRNSIADSFHSSINSIRSSLSWDTKRTLAQMLEIRDRLRRPKSVLSTWSKNTNSSTGMSIGSHGSNSFEKVSGMPSYCPDVDMAEDPYSRALENEDLMVIDRIDEEMEDV